MFADSTGVIDVYPDGLHSYYHDSYRRHQLFKICNKENGTVQIINGAFRSVISLSLEREWASERFFGTISMTFSVTTLYFLFWR